MSSEKRPGPNEGSTLCYLARCWLRGRHGNVGAIKPPIGWSKRVPVTIKHKFAYWPKWIVYKIESRLFRMYGQPLRDAWERSLQPISVDQWLDMAPAIAVIWLSGINTRNDLKLMQNRAFQMIGTYDGAMSEQCKQLLRDEVDFLQRLIDHESR